MMSVILFIMCFQCFQSKFLFMNAEVGENPLFTCSRTVHEHVQISGRNLTKLAQVEFEQVHEHELFKFNLLSSADGHMGK